MSALFRKLLRDVWDLRAQILAIALVVASGVAVFVALRDTYTSVVGAQLDFYERYRFADVFAHATRAPATLTRRVETIPGVAEVRARVVADVSADVPGVDELVTLRIIGVPAHEPSILNGVYLHVGRLPERDDEITINEAFAEANQLAPGAVLSATLNGHKQRLRVVGIGVSPEYTFQMRGTELLPDDRRFGVVWMEEGALGHAMDMSGAFNDISLSLTLGAKEDDVIRRIDALLATYGGLGAFTRDGVLSHKYLSSKLNGLRASSTAIPGVFLAVAAFLLNVVLARLIATQRGQIGTLKAFGYTELEIGLHYLEFVLITVLAGAALGILVGTWGGGELVALYRSYYRLPHLAFHLDPSTLVTGVGVALVSSCAGALGAVRRATTLPPAEAMRPEPPPAFHAGSNDSAWLRRLLGTVPRMALRNLARRPARTALSVLGVAFAAAIVVLGAQTGDAIDHVFELQFDEAERQDATVLFSRAIPAEAAKDLVHLPGVLRVEPFAAVPTILRHGHLSQRSAITGLPRDGTLKRLVESDGRARDLPLEGVMLSQWLANLLAVRLGDDLDVELMDGTGRVLRVPVTAVIDDLYGMSATMEEAVLTRLTGGPELVVGAYLDLDEGLQSAVYDRLKVTTQVASVALRGTSIAVFHRMMDKDMAVMNTAEIIFAVIIAFSVVFNSARTTLSERARELATMRVLGFTQAEAATVLLGELGVITLAAIPVGLALGRELAALVDTLAASDLFRLPLTIAPSTYATAGLVVLLSALISSLVVVSRVWRLDLVGVLKTRD